MKVDIIVFFFFQAEDGIRDYKVTGVQTCALPICRYPAILEDDKQGEAARALFVDAQAMLKQIVEERWLEARGVVGLWPANADGDDIVIWTDETRKVERARLFTLRQQLARAEGRANLALADFVAPI